MGALDETGQLKAGTATAGVKRQYLGCGQGRERDQHGAPAVCARAHRACADRRPAVDPCRAHQRPAKAAAIGLPTGLVFRTKGQLAIDLLTESFADGVGLDFVCGDEVYGNCTELRQFCEEAGQGYVPRVRSSFHLVLAGGPAVTCAQAARALGKGSRRWEVRSAGAGSKGARWYAWACLATASPRHCLLIRRHLRTGELAFCYCYVPEGKPVTTTRLIRAAGLRWPAEEDFEFGKDRSGLDQSQVRLYTAIARHTVLVMAALAACAVTAALLRDRTDTQPPPPARPGQPAPADLGMIPLTVPETRPPAQRRDIRAPPARPRRALVSVAARPRGPLPLVPPARTTDPRQRPSQLGQRRAAAVPVPRRAAAVPVPI